MNNFKTYYNIFSFSVIALYVMGFLKLWDEAPYFINLYSIGMRTAISLFFIAMYNPLFSLKYVIPSFYITIKSVEYDLIFTAGLFLMSDIIMLYYKLLQSTKLFQ